jgi:predicted NUDIX family NTP pyrophosphohydrolase
MEQSAGIIAYRKRNNSEETEFLLCTPDGPFWKNKELWCFPKGHSEKTDKDDLETAIREFYEETGFLFNENRCVMVNDFGKIKQNANKTVHVYSIEDINHEINSENLSCVDKIDVVYNGKHYKINEVRDFTWMTFDELLKRPFNKCYQEIFMKLSNEK